MSSDHFFHRNIFTLHWTCDFAITSLKHFYDTLEYCGVVPYHLRDMHEESFDIPVLKQSILFAARVQM